MTAGRPAKPVEQKRRVGTLRADRTPNHGNLAAVPAIERQDWELSVAEALDRVLEMGAPWLAKTDQPTVCALRDAVEFYGELRADPKAKPQDVIAASKRMTDLLSQLGFDPTARAKLGLAEVKAASTLERLKRGGS